MRKESNTGTTPQLTVQVVAEPASNWTDLEEKNGAGSEGMNTLQHIGVSVAVLVVVLAFLLIAGFIYRQKHSRSERSGVEQVTRPQHRQPSTAEDSTSVQGVCVRACVRACVCVCVCVCITIVFI